MFSNKDQYIKLYGFDEKSGAFTESFNYFWVFGTGYAANSTDIAPPETGPGYVAVFNKDEAAWSVVEDHRGKTVYSIENKSEFEVDYAGPIREGYTELKPDYFDTWTGSAWVDPRTPAEIEAHRLSLFPALKRRQFMRVLVLNGFDLDQIEAEINKIPDTQTRQLALIDWKDATEFWRTDETLLMVADLLGLDTARIDAMWEQGSTL
ncbi:hypothetical protein NI459_03985 [Acinetobacter schindleri]|uniref:hypothetical protein n=1 Tax=Acinetobacter schindleri TaxID=108981 RepID=UPI00209B8E7C|nr:hypothetical protein [Acinetobacter schindleri]MCO8066805.1 hypothetical protein [Acinetobacter schindleri]